MEKQSVTIYTVAREARVSMATVSRVVNGNPNVKPETRKKVKVIFKCRDQLVSEIIVFVDNQINRR